MLVLSANQKPRRAAAPSGVAEYFQDDGLRSGYEDCVAKMSTRRHPQNHNYPVRAGRGIGETVDRCYEVLEDARRIIASAK